MTKLTTDGGSNDELLTTTPPARQGSSRPFVNTMFDADDRSCAVRGQSGVRERTYASVVTQSQNTLLPKANVAQCGRGLTPHVMKQPSDAAARLNELGGKNMSPPRPEEKGCVISVHHCQSQVPEQLAGSLVLEKRAGDGSMGRSVAGGAEEEGSSGGLK